ncbi:MAG: hypothetical protein IJQ12_10535 [Lachnospiraceae bacterium]|nr:hypothetical protein [Lachnospiraceae bacterium]
MKKKVILVDMDDTLENFTEAWVDYANRRFGTSVAPEEITDWDPSVHFEGVSHDEMYDLILEDDFYYTLKPLEDAAHYLKKIMDAGHEVLIVTSTQHQVVPIKMEQVLFRFFPFLTWDQVIVTSRKQMLRGDILIDDAPHNHIGGDYEKILITAPHNRHFDAEAHGMIRVDNWEEIYREVMRIAEEMCPL